MSLNELQVPNPSQIVELFGKAVPPEQWRRELLENARDAGASKVIVDAWTDPETGLDLVRVSDDGHGMNPRELERRIRDLADPQRIEAHGIGARISTAKVSPAGVAWVSRAGRDTDAAMVVMRKQRGKWGLERFAMEGDERTSAVVEPFPGMLHPLARKSGTSVVLYGDGRSSTWKPGKAYSIALWIARRYWTFGGTSVYVHGWKGASTRRVPSTDELVDHYLEASGVVVLSDGSRASWYRVEGAKEKGRAASGARGLLQTGVAVRHGDELYDRADSNRVSHFGLYTRAAQGRALIVIEPALELHVGPNAERTRLVRQPGRDLPWRDWAASFTRQLPPELEDLLPASQPLDLEELAAHFGEEWRARLRSQPRPVRARRGDVQASDILTTVEGVARIMASIPEPEDHEEREERQIPLDEPKTPPDPPEPRKRPPVRVDPGGTTRAKRGFRHDVPKPVPIDPDEWTHGENLDFFYLEELNELHYRTNGEAIERQTRYWIERMAADLPDSVIRKRVEHAYAVEVVGKILHVLDVYAGRESWEDSLDDILTPRALTLASLGFHSVDAMIEEELRKLSQDAQAVAASEG
jgi:Histidine kinase-, DNA gyrase B-, and HSP90-like ATPase